MIIYKFLLSFDEIYIEKRVRDRDVDPHRSGTWMQHNPINNPLAIMSVSSQIYDEARRTFYSLNTFTFGSFYGLPVFLIGIGAENAMLLRSVRCKSKTDEYKDYADDIRSCLTKAAVAGQTPSQELRIHHFEDLYLNLVTRGQPPVDVPTYWSNDCRLVRPDIADACAFPGRKRFSLNVILRKYEVDGRNADRRSTVSFELYIQNKRACA